MRIYRIYLEVQFEIKPKARFRIFAETVYALILADSAEFVE